MKAVFEAEEMHDWNSAKLYSEKALRSIKTDKIYPEKISYWKIPNNKIFELTNAHESLLLIYENAKIADPYNLAKAITSLDCWSEQQEENWQTWDIKNCKNDFLVSINAIYEKIAKKKEIKNYKELELKTSLKDEATIVTNNKKDEILQIIYFDFDKSELSNESLNKLKSFIEKYRDRIDQYIVVGHADTKGTNYYNLNLSLKRAEIVRNILNENGIDLAKIKILGKGEQSLAIKTPDNTKHPGNRRVEIKKSN